MRQIAFAMAMALVATPLAAQDEEDGTTLMDEGARLFLKGLQQQMEPALEGLQGWAEEMGPAVRGFLTEMGPALGEIFEKVEDWSAYHKPEMLPNGDIIMRKKTPEEMEAPSQEEDGAVDL